MKKIPNSTDIFHASVKQNCDVYKILCLIFFGGSLTSDNCLMVLLCIDDDPEDVELFQEAIHIIDKSLVCVAATNGREGLDILRNTIPDCIFLDINMPIMDGKETLINIRRDRRFRSVPVFILSTSNDKYELELCKALGANQCIVKPASFNKLVESLRSVLDLNSRAIL